MSFIRTKTINGRQYKYLVTGVRQGDKVNQKVVKYLGPTDPKYRVGKKREKSNASIYVRNITPEEQPLLETATKSPQAFTRDRAKLILFSAQHLFARQICDKLNCGERKVRIAIKEFNKKGIAALERGKAPGAKPKFTLPVKQIILLHFAKEPRKFDYAFTTWTLPRFRKHLIENNIVQNISIEQLRQIIMQAGGKLQRSKRWQYSPDKEFLKKNKE